MALFQDLSNDGTMIGLISPDGTTAKLETTARGMCLDDIDRRREMTRTVTIHLTRR